MLCLLFWLQRYKENTKKHQKYAKSLPGVNSEFSPGKVGVYSEQTFRGLVDESSEDVTIAVNTAITQERPPTAHLL